MKRLVCPFCGGDLTWVIKHLLIDPIDSRTIVGLRCYRKECKQFYTYVECQPEETEKAKKLLRKQVKSIQEANHACE